jgi:hypothetical protein
VFRRQPQAFRNNPHVFQPDPHTPTPHAEPLEPPGTAVYPSYCRTLSPAFQSLA